MTAFRDGLVSRFGLIEDYRSARSPEAWRHQGILQEFRLVVVGEESVGPDRGLGKNYQRVANWDSGLPSPTSDVLMKSHITVGDRHRDGISLNMDAWEN